MNSQQPSDDGAPVLPPALEAALAAEREPPADGTQPWDRLAEAIGRERGLRARLREQPTSMRLVWLAVATGLVLALNLFALPRPDLGVMPSARLGLDLLLYAVPLVLLWSLVLRPIHRPAIRGAEWAGLVGVAAVALVASLPAAHADHPASLVGIGDDFVHRARGCFLYGTAMALPVLLLARTLMRDGRSPWSIGGLLAVFATLVANVSLYLHCPIVAPAHLWAGHVAILGLFGLAALWTRITPARFAGRSRT